MLESTWSFFSDLGFLPAGVGIPPTGGYISLAKIIFMLVMITPWLALAPWVHKDARHVRAPRATWSAGVLGIGALAVLFWLLVPNYFLGLLFYVLLTGSVLTAYVVYRNGRVSEEAKVLTSEHLASLFGRRGEKHEADLTTRVTLYNSTGQVVLPPEARTAPPAEYDGYRLSQDLLYDVLWRRASMADISPASGEARIRFVIDGVTIERQAIGLKESDLIIQYLKPIAGTDPQDRRRPQQGKITVDIANSPVDLLLGTTGTTNGQRMQLRIVQQTVRTKLDELGMDEEILARAKEINSADGGLLIVSGWPGSGITSTLYSLLRTHDAFIKQLATLEEEPVVDMENITQSQYENPGKLAGLLASVLRREPDVVMIDHCEDPKAAEIIVKISGSKNILLGMHAKDSFAALAKWLQLCGDAASAVRNLRAVLCQMLVRKICPACREAYRPDPQMLAKANLPVKQAQTFYRPPTSPLTDEKGRQSFVRRAKAAAIMNGRRPFELLEMTDEIRELIISAVPLAKIKAACRKNKMLYLQEQALRKVMASITSIEEVIRVSQKKR